MVHDGAESGREEGRRTDRVHAHETPMKPVNRDRTWRIGTAGKALKLPAQPLFPVVYTERVGSSNLSPPTSLR